MKIMRRILLIAAALLLTAANALAIRMDSNGGSWFLTDGRSVQTKKVFTETGAVRPGILCYSQQGELLWEHTFRTPAIGQSYCQLLEDGTIAFLYHDQNHQYFVEFFDLEGKLIAKRTRELYTKDGVLVEGGSIFVEKFPQHQGMLLSIRQRDGHEKRWEFQETEKMNIYSAKTLGNSVCIELNLQSGLKTTHSLLFADASQDNVLWEYRLDTDLLVKAYTANEQGGITLFVQKDAPDDQYELEMITLDSRGQEISRAKVDGIPAVMAINVLNCQQDGIYQLWGYGYEVYGENAIIHAKVNAQGEVVERMNIPTNYAACVRYVNDEIYVMEYENNLESFNLLTFEEFTGR